MKGKVIREGASVEEMEKHAASIAAGEKGKGKEVREGAEDSTGGDPRCPSDWIVVDCFWCATSNCCNPRWHAVFCRKCGKPSTY